MGKLNKVKDIKKGMKRNIILIGILTIFFCGLISAFNFPSASTPAYNYLNITEAEYWVTTEGTLDDVADISGSWINNDLGWITDDTNCSGSDCANIVHWNNESLWNQTLVAWAVNTTAQLGLTINTTYNIQTLLNGTNIRFGEVSGATFNLSGVIISDWSSVNGSAVDTNCSGANCANIIYWTNASLFNQTILAELVNTTALTINTTDNIQVLINGSNTRFGEASGTTFNLSGVIISSWSSVNGSAVDTNCSGSNCANIIHWANGTLFNQTDLIGAVNTTFNLQSILNNTAMNFTDITLSQKITFALGEIIDNIVDSWITITGNLFVSNEINTTTLNATNIEIGDVVISSWSSVNGSAADTNCSGSNCANIIHWTNGTLFNQTVLAELVNTSSLTINTTDNIQILLNGTNTRFAEASGTSINLSGIIISSWTSVNGSAGADTNCSGSNCANIVHWANSSLWNQTLLAWAVNTTAKLGVAVNTTAQLGLAVNTTAQLGLTINTTENIGNLYNATALLFAQMNNNTATIQMHLNDSNIQIGNITALSGIDVTSNNVSNTDCIIFDSGGEICSGA